MCGIAGFFNRQKDYKTDIVRMIVRMKHRGPDAQDYWSDETHSVVLGHARLSILDLSQAGSQPMVSHDGRYVMVLNGEIYNWKDLQKRLLLEGKVRVFRSRSDTEVFLECVAAYGFQQALQMSIGMFAVGVFDKKEKRFYLGRDRIGEKPVYYGFLGKSFIFASEIGCIAELGRKSLDIDRDALSLYFLHGYIPAPYTVYRGIRKLDAGNFIELEMPYSEVRIHKYWDLMEVAEYGKTHRFQGSHKEAADELDRLVRQSVRRQLAADVPVGAFLSGGIDSSLIAAVMQNLSEQKVKTFSIGFTEKDYNEAVYARNTAAYLGTDHTDFYVTADDVISVIPQLPYMYGEPFADSSQLPTYLVSKLAREKVTVSLSGDGGDELFCGYNSYRSCRNIWSKIRHIPMPFRKAGAGLLKTELFPGDRIKLIASCLDVGCPEELYSRSIINHSGLKDVVPDGKNPEYKYTSYPFHFLGYGNIENIMLMDLLVYHPDDILVKVDRSAMAVSLETRVPLLDKDIIEFSMTLPLQYKYDGKIQKKVLRNVLYRYVPKEMMDRPKKGFAVPVMEWVRGGRLREWAQDLLSADKIRREGILDPGIVSDMYNRFQMNGKGATGIWYLLMFEEWFEKCA